MTRAEMRRREVHARLVRDALHYTRMAFASALRGGRRADCLRVALVALDGAATTRGAPRPAPPSGDGAR